MQQELFQEIKEHITALSNPNFFTLKPKDVQDLLDQAEGLFDQAEKLEFDISELDDSFKSGTRNFYYISA